MIRSATALVLSLALIALAGCSGGTGESYTGYMEGEFVFVGPVDSGHLKSLTVSEGDAATTGGKVFELDDSTETAALNAATAKLEQAEASLTLSRLGLERAEQLLERGVVSQSRLDDARSAFDRDKAAAQAARADVADAQTRLARRTVYAPVTGKVQEVYFRPGEFVGAGQSVISILPPGNVKVRFYIPEPMRAALRTGDGITVSCDGCPDGLTAKVRFISQQAEYAPPVIFSREERSKQLYMVEATPDDRARTLPVGQPVTVTVLP
ncbi:MAG: HlyD family secretion protein, partial [Hyphomicrobiales bacterium]